MLDPLILEIFNEKKKNIQSYVNNYTLKSKENDENQEERKDGLRISDCDRFKNS